jgi:hypothetical protein
MAVTFAGTLTFNANGPVGVISLRSFTNQRNEFTITTQTVAPITTISSTPLVMAQFADGNGWKTQLILVNPTDQLITGTVQFFGQGNGTLAATPLTLMVNGQIGITFSYAIPSRTAVRLDTSGSSTITQIGSVRVLPTSGSVTPAGFAIFSLTTDGVTTAQASVTGQPSGSSFRMFVEANATPGSTGSFQSGIAIANTGSTSATVNFELLNLDGTNTGLTAIVNVPAFGHTARFLLEIMPTLPLPFQGVLRMTSGTSQIVVVGLRTRYNERGDFLITTTPASNEAVVTTTAEIVFPHIVNMGGYATQFVVFSGTQSQSAIGTVRFFNPSGQPLSITFK